MVNLEDFTPVKSFENYLMINKDNQKVYSLKSKRILKGFLLGGYQYYRISNRKVLSLHRIMLETFNSDRSSFMCANYEDRYKIDINKLVINHKDGNKLNNSLDNLEWCSEAYNNKEAYRIGVRKVSEKTRQQFLRNCVNEESKKRATDNLEKYRQYCKANNIKQNANGIKIKVTDKNGKENIFISCEEASKFLSVNKSTVIRASKRKNNYIKDYKIERLS